MRSSERRSEARERPAAKRLPSGDCERVRPGDWRERERGDDGMDEEVEVDVSDEKAKR